MTIPYYMEIYMWAPLKVGNFLGPGFSLTVETARNRAPLPT